MIYAISILFWLAILHFIYEGIILPSIRLNLRYKLFVLRDELRSLRHDKGGDISTEIYNAQEVIINNAISVLPYVDFIRIAAAREAGPELKKKAEERESLINSCNVKEVKDIYSKTMHIVFCAFISNIGSWFIYIVPVAIVVGFFQKIFSLVKDIVSLSEN